MIGGFISAFEATATSLMWAGARGGRRQRQQVQRIVVRQTSNEATGILTRALRSEKVARARLEADNADLRERLDVAEEMIRLMAEGH